MGWEQEIAACGLLPPPCGRGMCMPAAAQRAGLRRLLRMALLHRCWPGRHINLSGNNAAGDLTTYFPDTPFLQYVVGPGPTLLAALSELQCAHTACDDENVVRWGHTGFLSALNALPSPPQASGPLGAVVTCGPLQITGPVQQRPDRGHFSLHDQLGSFGRLPHVSIGRDADSAQAACARALRGLALPQWPQTSTATPPLGRRAACIWCCTHLA